MIHWEGLALLANVSLADRTVAKSGQRDQASALERDRSGGASHAARASRSAAVREADLKVKTGRLDHLL